MANLRLAAVFPHVELLLFGFFCWIISLHNLQPRILPVREQGNFIFYHCWKFDWSLRGLFRMGRKLPVETKHAQVQSKGLTQEAQNYPENKKFFSTFGYKIVQFQTQMGV